MYKPGVTLAMIVKDDADRLKRCLLSAAPIANRIVVVDTGSTDGSQLVAKDCKAELIEVPWPGAFDIARNSAFDRVKTDWTLWLDSDEWFEPGEAEKLNRSLKSSDFFAALITRIDLNVHGEDDGCCIDLLRIWRTHPQMRVHGIVHETFPIAVIDRLNGIRPVPALDVRLHHDGYVGDAGMTKMKRNVTLLWQELERSPDSFPVKVKLAEGLNTLGDPEVATMAAELADGVAEMRPGYESYAHGVIALELALRTASEELILSDRTFRWLKTIADRFSGSPATVWAYARACFRRGDLEQAHASLLRLAEFRRTGRFNRLASLNPRIFGPSLDDNLREVERLLGLNTTPPQDEDHTK